MATVKVYDQNKEESGELTLASDVFEIEVRPEILNLVVRAQMAAKRAGTHNAKTRAFVSGGGVKPWKQKGTGRRVRVPTARPFGAAAQLFSDPAPGTTASKSTARCVPWLSRWLCRAVWPARTCW